MRVNADPYRLQMAIGVTGLCGAALALGLGVTSVHVAPAAAHHVAVAGLRFSYPAMNAAAAILFALAALGAAVLIVTARAAWGQVRAHRRLVGALPIAGPLPGHGAVYVVDASALLAFCAGWLRPRVYVSSAALSALSRAQLDAVLAHEHHHRRLRDPLRLATGRILSQALFFLPVLRPLHHHYGDVAELRADAAALAASGGTAAPLAGALLAFGTSAQGDVVGISPERVDSLLGQPPAWRPPWLLLALGFMTFGALTALVWRASANASAQFTLGLPVASSQPCLLVLALVPVVACLVGAISRLAPR